MMTGTGKPFSSVGVYSHCLTALMAASSSSGTDRSTFTSVTRPLGPMTASRMTMPCTRADWATGYFQAQIYKQLLEELGYAVSEPADQPTSTGFSTDR